MPAALVPPNTILIEHMTSNYSAKAYTRGNDGNDCTASIEFTSVSDRRPSENEPGLTERARSYERYVEGTYCAVNENGTPNRKLIVQVKDPIVFDYEEWQCTVTPGERNSDDIVVVEKPNFNPRLNWLVEFDRQRKDFRLVRNLSLTALYSIVTPFYRTALTCHAPEFTRKELFKNLDNITSAVPYTPFGFTLVKTYERDTPGGLLGNKSKLVYPELKQIVTDLYGRTDSRITYPLEKDYMCPKNGLMSFHNTSNTGEETVEFAFTDLQKNVRKVCFGDEDDQWITYNSVMATNGLSEEDAKRVLTSFCGTFYPIFSNAFRDFQEGGHGGKNGLRLTPGPETALYFEHDLFNILPNDCRSNNCTGVDQNTRVIKTIETQTPRFVIQMPRQSEIRPFRISDVNPAFSPPPCPFGETCDPAILGYHGMEGYTTLLPDYRLTKEFYSEFVDMLRLFHKVEFKAVSVNQKIYTYNREPLARRVRDDGRCGKNFLAPNGNIGECDPNSDLHCCSQYGWCGQGESHCSFAGVDYKEPEGASKNPSATLTCGDGFNASRIVYIANSLCETHIHENRSDYWCNTDEGRFKPIKVDFVPPYLRNKSAESGENTHLNSAMFTITMRPNKGGFFVPGMPCLWRVYLCGTKPRSNVDLLKEVVLVDTTEAWDPALYDVFNIRGHKYGFKTSGQPPHNGDGYDRTTLRFPEGYTGFGNKIIRPHRCPFGFEIGNREDMWNVNHHDVDANFQGGANMPRDIPNGIVDGILKAGEKFPDPKAIKIVSMNRVVNSPLCSCVKIPNTCALPQEYRYLKSYKPRETNLELGVKLQKYQTSIVNSLGFHEMSMWRFFNVKTVGYCEIMGIRSPYVLPITEILGQMCLEEDRFSSLHVHNAQNGEEINMVAIHNDTLRGQPVVDFVSDPLMYASVVLKPVVGEGLANYYHVTCEGLPTECSVNSRLEKQNAWKIILRDKNDGLNNVVISYMIEAGEFSNIEIFHNSSGEATHVVLMENGVWSAVGRETFLNITVNDTIGNAFLVDKTFFHQFQLIQCGWAGILSVPELTSDKEAVFGLNPHMCEETEGVIVDITRVGEQLVSCTVKTKGLCNLLPTVSFNARYKIETGSERSERVYEGRVTCADYHIERTNLNKNGVHGWCNFENNRKTTLTRSIGVDERLIACKVLFPNHREIMHIEALNQLTYQCVKKPTHYKPTVETSFTDDILTVGCLYPDYLEDNICNLDEKDDDVAMILHFDSSFETRKSVFLGVASHTGVCNVPKFLGRFTSGLEDVQCHTSSGRKILTVNIHGPTLYKSFADVVGAKLSVSCAKTADIVTGVDLNSTNDIGDIKTHNVKEVPLIEWYKYMIHLQMIEELNKVVTVKHHPSSRQKSFKHWSNFLFANNKYSDYTNETTKRFLGYVAVGLLVILIVAALVIIGSFLLLLAKKKMVIKRKKKSHLSISKSGFQMSAL
ncbi:hypothetical protein HOLleu_43311 [Holothuria leucospilota]|uniref:Chitin-binding type-1 domain-containing protein n=1 Tax=Holothuria leucospilota TaxID=206669 RepID=A0A9Q1BB55_HOLLE|nr:hypothetical protein HOLleu_43311 [Holothuria leucospilota]